VDVGSEKGTIDQEEKEFIQNVFQFDDLTAEEIATHRTDLRVLWMEDSMEDWDNTIHLHRHTRYPVCQDSIDHIVGILNAKDYFRLRDKSREVVMAQAVFPAYFVPETVKADVLFRNMKHTRNKLAVVLDEYGGVSGIVTINDLIEQLVGELEPEDLKSPEAPAIKLAGNATWKIHGSASLDEISETLGISLPSQRHDTFNGLVFDTLGIVPPDGSTPELETAGLHIRITKLRDHQIQEALVCLPEQH